MRKDGKKTGRIWCQLILFMSGVVVTGGAGYADDAPPDTKLADYLLKGWQSEREKLVTGAVEIAATINQGSERWDERIDFSFDRGMGCVKSFVRDGRLHREGTWMLRPDFLAQCAINSNSSSVVCLIKPTDTKLYFVKDLDPRCFGATIIGDYTEAPSFGEVVARMNEVKNRGRLIRIDQPGKEIYEMEWVYTSEKINTKITMLINSANGFSCERFRLLKQEDGD